MPVKTQYFPKNQDQDHANKDSGLLHKRPHSRITHDPNTVASTQACQSDSQAAAQMQESPIVLLACGHRRHQVTYANSEYVSADDGLDRS